MALKGFSRTSAREATGWRRSSSTCMRRRREGRQASSGEHPPATAAPFAADRAHSALKLEGGFDHGALAEVEPVRNSRVTLLRCCVPQ